MTRQWISRARLGSLAMLACALLCLGMGAVKAPENTSPEWRPTRVLENTPPGLKRRLEASPGQERAAVDAALRVNYHMADISSEVREQTDFLVTPALLVQEAVSDGVILTYPEE